MFLKRGRKKDGDGYIRAYLGTFRIFQVLVMMIVVVKDVWRQCYVAISHLARKRFLSLQLHLLVVGAKIRGWGEKNRVLINAGHDKLELE